MYKLFATTERTKKEFFGYIIQKMTRYYPEVNVRRDHDMLRFELHDTEMIINLEEVWQKFLYTGDFKKVIEFIDTMLEPTLNEKAIDFQQENIFPAIRTNDFVERMREKGKELMYKPLQEDLVIVYFHSTLDEVVNYLTKEVEKAFEDHWYIPDIARENISNKKISLEEDDAFQNQFLVKRFYHYKKGERFYFSLPTFKKTYVFPLQEKDENFEKEAIRKLKKATLHSYASSQEPLSLHVYAFENGKIKTVL